MSIQSRITRGIGFGALGIAMLGFQPAAIVSDQVGASSNRFIPLRVGEAVAKSAKVVITGGRVVVTGAKGLPKAYGAIAEGLPIPALQVKTSYSFALGEASTAATPSIIRLSYGSRAVEAGGHAKTGSASVVVSNGDIRVSGGGYSRTEVPRMVLSLGPVGASGILNPSEEEIILMYRAVRRTRALANHKLV